MVSLMLRPLYFGGKSPRYTPKRTDGPHSRSGRFGEENNLVQIQMYFAKLTTLKIHCPTDIILREEKQLWLIDQLDAQLRYIISLLLESCTCFEQLCAHHPEYYTRCCINIT